MLLKNAVENAGLDIESFCLENLPLIFEYLLEGNVNPLLTKIQESDPTYVQSNLATPVVGDPGIVLLDTNQTLLPGDFQLDSAVSSFDLLLTYGIGYKWSFEDLGAASINHITIGDINDNFMIAGTLQTGPIVVDVSLSKFTVTGSASPNEYLVDFLPSSATTNPPGPSDI